MVGIARQQPPAGLRLQPRHMLADGGLADPQLPGGGGKPTRLGDGDKAAQQNGIEQQVHESAYNKPQ